MIKRMTTHALLLVLLLGLNFSPAQAAARQTAPRHNRSASGSIRSATTGQASESLLQAVVALQAPRGRQAAVMVSAGSFQEVVVDHPGARLSFSAPTGQYTLTAVADCHLPAVLLNVPAPSAGHRVMLTAGDVTGDDQINLNDLAAIGRMFSSTGVTGCANLDGDPQGNVNILDLTLAASNYGKTGPTTWEN